MKYASRIGAIAAILGTVWGCSTSGSGPSAASSKEPNARSGANSVIRNTSRLSIAHGLLVAHALGGVGGVQYTNSLEALRCNYRRGFRWFEVDLALTKDGDLVCFHPGNEKFAGLDRQIEDLTSSDVASAKYVNRYGIPSFRALLKETERLGDVVLVTDTKVWSPAMLAAVKRAVDELPSGRTTRVVLQSYGEQDIEAVKRLSQEIGGEVILTLYMTGADDPTVEILARKYDVIGVVADAKRFSPWLASRLDAMQVPILVHTINDHREIMKLIGAGADGFYTDSYRPYGVAIEDAAQAAECTAGDGVGDVQKQWTVRDMANPGAYVLKSPCARRQGVGIQLEGCGEEVAIEGPSLSVPPGREMHMDLAVRGGNKGGAFWFEIAEKNRGKRLHPKERVAVAARELRSISYDFPLPEGSPGINVRLGVSEPKSELTVERLRVEHSAGSAQPLVPSSVARQHFHAD